MTFTDNQARELENLGFDVMLNCAKLLMPGSPDTAFGGGNFVYIWVPGSVRADKSWYADTGNRHLVAFDDPLVAAVYLKVETGA